MKEKLKERWGPQFSCLALALLLLLLGSFLVAIQIHFNPKSLSRRSLSCFPVDRWWSLSAACMVPLGATPRKRKFTLSTATPHCLPPDLHATCIWFFGYMYATTSSMVEPRSPVAKPPASSRRGTWHEPQWQTCFVATRLGTEAQGGANTTSLANRGGDPGSWRGRR